MKQALIIIGLFIGASCFAQTPKSPVQKTEIMVKTGHERNVLRVSLSPDETKLFTVDGDLFGILWDVPTGRELRSFANIQNGVFTSDGQTLLLSLANSTFKNIDLLGNTLKTFPGEVTGIYVLNNQSTLYPDEGLAFYSNNIININTGVTTKTQTPEYSSIAYAPSRGIVAIGGNTGTLAFCDVKDGKNLKRIDMGFGVGDRIIQFLNFAQDGNTLLVGCGESTNRILIYSYDTNSILRDIKYPTDRRSLTSAALAPDGKTFVVVTNKNIEARSVQTGDLVWQIDNSLNYRTANFNKTGSKVILTGTVKHIGFLDAATGELLQTINATNLDGGGELYLTTDKNTLSTGTKKFLLNWNLSKGAMEKSHINAADNTRNLFTNDGKLAFSAFYNNTGVMNLMEQDVSSGKPIYNYPASPGAGLIYNKGASFDSKYVFSSGAFDAHYPDAKQMEIWDIVNHQKIAAFNNSIYAGAFMNTKNVVVSQESKKSPVLNFSEIPSGKLLYQITDTLMNKDADQFLFSNTDKYLAINHTGGISLIDLATKKDVELSNRPAGATLITYAFTTDDRFLVLGDIEGNINYYNITTHSFSPYKTIVAHVSGFLNGISGINFSKDGKLMFTSGGDKTIKVWNFAAQTLIATLYSFPDTNDWAVITPDGHFDASPGAQENMYYVRGVNTIALADLYETFYTPQLLVRILAGERIAPVNVDINTIHPKPVVKIKYSEPSRNLTVVSDNPVYQNTTGTASITVSATAALDKVDEIRLFQNGKVVNLATRNLFVTNNSDGNSTKTYTINLLPGANNIRALALNSQRTESKAEEIIVNYRAAGAAAQVNTNTPANIAQGGIVSLVDKDAIMYLMVVGINKYKNPQMSLNYALADATAFKDEAEKDARSEIGTVKTYFITDEKADKTGISNAFAEIQKLARPQDVFVFYYAGHGVISEKNKDFYLVPNDVTDLKNVDAALEARGISSHMLQTYAIDIPAQKQLFILDACQSAGAFATLLADNSNQQKSLSVVARSTGTHWIAASGSQQFANEFSQLGHGAFTYVLLKAMAGEAASNKMITVNGLKNFLQNGVPDLMKKYNGSPQYPASYGQGSDFPVEVLK